MSTGRLGIQWHITSNCLNKCEHCYMFDENYTPYDCTYEDFQSAFDSVSEFCKKYDFLDNYSITGGSPLLNPHHEKIFNLLRSNNKSFVLMDIPEMVNDENISTLKKYQVRSYQVSLDGMEQIHDSIRGEGSFKRTIESCIKLSENGIYPVIMFTMNQKNYKELIPLCTFIKENLSEFRFGYDFAVSIGNTATNNDAIPENYVDTIMHEYYDFATKFNNEQLNAKKEFVLKPTTYKVMRRSKDDRGTSFKGSYSHVSGCYIGWSSVCITETGDVLPCRRLPIVLGNLREESFENIFLQSPLLKKFRRYSEYLKGCDTCEFSLICKGCPAITFGLTGDCFNEFPYCFYGARSKKNNNLILPDISSSNEEEIQLIRNTMDNQIISNLKNITSDNPNILRAYAKIIQTNSQRDFYNDNRSWQKKFGIELFDDEVAAVYRIGSSKNMFNQ